MITRQATDGSTWRQAEDGSWHEWGGDVDQPDTEPETLASQEPMVNMGDLQDDGPDDDPAENIGIISDIPDNGGAQGLDYASGLAGSALQGASASWSDEILAAPMTGVAQITGAAPDDESVADTYRKMKESLRTRQKSFSDSNPGSDFGGRMVGGMLPFAKAATTAKSLAALGGSYGATEYAGGLEDFADADLADAAVQVGLSAAMPVAMQKTGQGIKSWLANRDDKEVQALLNSMVGTSGKTPSQIRAAAKDMGPEASLADVTGTTGVGYAQGAVGAGGSTAAAKAEHNLSKVYAAKDRIRDTMSSVSGKKDGEYFSSLDALKKSRKDTAEKLYGAALDEGTVLPTKRMLHIFNNNPMVKDAWESVKYDYAKNSLPLPKLFSDVNGKSMNVDGDRWPNMRAMQELKWSMDKRLKELKGSLDSSGKREYSRALDDYRDFMSDVNKQNPTFKQANAQYAGDSAMIDAQERGFKDGLGSDKIEQQLESISGLGKSEKDAYLQGVMSNVYGKMGSSPEHVLGNINKASSENSRRALEQLVGEKGAKKLLKRFKTERRYRDVEGKVLQGSQTQPRQKAVSEIEGKRRTIPLSEIAGALTPTGMIRSIAKAVGSSNPKISQDNVVEFADIITRSGGVESALLRLEMAGLDRAQAQGVLQAVITSGAAVMPGQVNPE